MNELHKKVDLITSDPDLKLQYFENLTLFDLYEVYKEPVESWDKHDNFYAKENSRLWERVSALETELSAV